MSQRSHLRVLSQHTTIPDDALLWDTGDGELFRLTDARSLSLSLVSTFSELRVKWTGVTVYMHGRREGAMAAHQLVATQ